MREVEIFWVGTTKKGKNCIGVSYDEKGFECKAFINITNEELFKTMEVETTIKVPKAAL